MTDPIMMRGIERILVILVAGLLIFVGYRLYLHGHSQGETRVQWSSEVARIVLSGVGPGLACMALGAGVLVFSLVSGGARLTEGTVALDSGATPPANAQTVQAPSVFQDRLLLSYPPQPSTAVAPKEMFDAMDRSRDAERKKDGS